MSHCSCIEDQNKELSVWVKKRWIVLCLFVWAHICLCKTFVLCQHVQMFPCRLLFFSLYASSIILTLLSRPTDLLLLISVIPTFYLPSLSLPPNVFIMYLSVHCSSYLIFSLIQVIFLDLSCTTEMCVFIASKLEWYNSLLDLSVNMLLMPI